MATRINKYLSEVGYCSRRVEPNNILDFIKYPKRIFPIGRLDKPSEGLIFLTNDGDIVNKILRARNNPVSYTHLTLPTICSV